MRPGLQKEADHAGAREQVRPLSFGAALDGPWEVVLMGSYQHRDPYADHSGEVGRAEGLPQQQREAAVNGPRVQALASLARSTGHALMIALVLGAPISASLFGALMLPEDYAASSRPEMAAAIEVLQFFFTVAGLLLWVTVAVWWLFVFLFTSRHHHLRPLHESLTGPALVLYLAASVPMWPYLVLPPWGSAA